MDNNTLREMIIAKMQNGNFELKPCPFCGGEPNVMGKDFFEVLETENGRACIDITCNKCRLELRDHTSEEHDYYIREFIIVEKWNTRV